jgi:zinc transport system substrate-binding protein
MRLRHARLNYARLICALLAGLLPSGAAHADDLKVVVTTKPIHSLVAGVMSGVGDPTLLVEGSASPHTFSLKPSGATAIQTADVFIRVADTTEPFTDKISKTLPLTVTFVTLADTAGLTLWDRRTSTTFDTHAHDQAAPDQHGHGSPGTPDDDDDDHAHGKDGHVWLDPANAKLMTAEIARVLSARYPQHASIFATNATGLAAKLDALAADIAQQTEPVAGRPFIVFHDATQYFERRFGLGAVGSITVSPDVQPSAKRLTALRHKIGELGAVCVFAEPMFQPKLVAAVTERTLAKSGTLDPEGLALPPGPDLYFTLLRNLATSIATCLKPVN